MKNDDLYAELLDATMDVYTQHPALSGFAPFPDDIQRQPITPFHCACADAFSSETELVSKNYPSLQNALLSAGPAAYWRQTYKGTDIGNDFMDRFACYCIVGDGGPFSSDLIRLYMVYMPCGLYYPWHNHPAEEMYLVVSGSAVFKRKNCADKVLTSGDTSFHKSNQPHAMETVNDPVLCLVAWRNKFETPPVLTK